MKVSAPPFIAMQNKHVRLACDSEKCPQDAGQDFKVRCLMLSTSVRWPPNNLADLVLSKPGVH